MRISSTRSLPQRREGATMSDHAITLRAARLGTVAAALILGGCMNFIPAYERPAAPVPATYAPESMPAGGSAAGVAAAEIDWQRYFADARLRRLIEIALANNRDLRVAILNIEQARAAYQIKRADELPTLGGRFTAQRQPSASGGVVNTYSPVLREKRHQLHPLRSRRWPSQAAAGAVGSDGEAH